MKPRQRIEVKTSTVASDIITLQKFFYDMETHGESDFKKIINSVNKEIVQPVNNVFLLPSCASGKTFIAETSKINDLWNKKTLAFCDIAMKVLTIMPSLLLQKLP